ncbi:unnamed protein product, partial [Gordionus sp. m RMFG-2023]
CFKECSVKCDDGYSFASREHYQKFLQPLILAAATTRRPVVTTRPTTRPPPVTTRAPVTTRPPVTTTRPPVTTTRPLITTTKPAVITTRPPTISWTWPIWTLPPFEPETTTTQETEATEEPNDD